MKSAMRLTAGIGSLVILVFLLSFFVACDGSNPGPSATETVTNQLKSGSWRVNTVTVDGVVSNDFAGMTLAFTASAYTSTNASPVWPASGSWNFTRDDAKVLKRNDGVEVAIDAISDNTLVLSLTWSKRTLGNGREKSVSGRHVFNLRK